MANSDEYLTEDASKMNEYDDSMKISMEEEHNNVEYQEILKVDVENISKNKNNMETDI